MAHLIDIRNNRASMAFVGEVPWHGLGQNLSPGQPLEVWQQEAGLDWEAKVARVKYERDSHDLLSGRDTKVLENSSNFNILYRSDTGDELSIVTDRYKPVQPKEVIEFFRDLTTQYDFQLETAGVLMGGKKIWALAKTPHTLQLRDNDRVNAYILLYTSFDGSLPTSAKGTSIRVVCNNTLTMAEAGKAEYTARHSTTFDAKQAKINLKVGEAWEEFSRQAKEMSNRIVSQQETVQMFLAAYHNLSNQDEIEKFQKDEKNNKQATKLIERLVSALFTSPGANLASARGTLWGAVNAVTYDVDHSKPARSTDNRLNNAWFGSGETIKQRALEYALAKVG